MESHRWALICGDSLPALFSWFGISSWPSRAIWICASGVATSGLVLKESTYLGRGISQHPAPSKEVSQQVFHNPGKSQSVGFSPVGQEVGRATTVRPVRQVVDQLIEEYHDAVERLNELMEK